MKYACLVYLDEAKLAKLTEREWNRLRRETATIEEDLRRSGHLAASETLAPITAATSLRICGGRLTTADGPVPEDDTGEQLGAFLVIEARDLNEAIRLAGRIPAARFGGIEIRPICGTPGNRIEDGGVELRNGSTWSD